MAQIWQEEPTVYILDREPNFCQTAKRAVRAAGFREEFYATVGEMLENADPTRAGCLIVDPETLRESVVELIQRLADHSLHVPTIVASDHGEVPAVVAAMRGGAINYLKKPCSEADVSAAVREAIAWDAEHRHEIIAAAANRRRLGRLTEGERQVLEMLINGMTNQEVAAALERSVRTIEVRRAKIRRKMRAKSLADLVRQTVGSK